MSTRLSRLWSGTVPFRLALVPGGMFVEKLARKLMFAHSQWAHHLHNLW